ncbi:MAG: DUF600 family protein [Clostridia bacterium]|nr:DUF600 family protein [Clostridia bacterium]
MLHHSKKIKEIYGNIQRKLYYMIPEKWDRLYLYSSVIDNNEGKQTGELYFYYIPKGILKKKPVNVYEIPNKFNVDENEYLVFVKNLYNDIKILREELKKSTKGKMWSNITISIEDLKFKIEFRYDDIEKDEFDSYERHIIWRYHYLGIGPEQVNNKDKEILDRYFNSYRIEETPEFYEERIYLRDIENTVAYNTTTENISNQDDEYEENETNKATEEQKKKNKNQLLLSIEEIEEIKKKK